MIFIYKIMLQTQHFVLLPLTNTESITMKFLELKYRPPTEMLDYINNCEHSVVTVIMVESLEPLCLKTAIAVY